MRSMLALVVLGLTLPASAQVNLVVRADGTKSIYNIPGNRSQKSRSVDFNWLAEQRDRESKYDEIIGRHSKKHGVDPVLVKAVIQVESGYDPFAQSYKGARGLMQLMPATARRFGVADIYDPEQNIRGGVEYLKFLLSMFKDDVTRTLAGYNAGENAVVRYKGVPPYEETVLYVQKALTVYYGRPFGRVSTGTGGSLRARIAVGSIKFNQGIQPGRKLGGGFKSDVTTTSSTTSTRKLGKASETNLAVLGSM